MLWEMRVGMGTRFALENVRVGLRNVLRIIGGVNDWFVWEIIGLFHKIIVHPY